MISTLQTKSAQTPRTSQTIIPQQNSSALLMTHAPANRVANQLISQPAQFTNGTVKLKTEHGTMHNSPYIKSEQLQSSVPRTLHNTPMRPTQRLSGTSTCDECSSKPAEQDDGKICLQSTRTDPPTTPATRPQIWPPLNKYIPSKGIRSNAHMSQYSRPRVLVPGPQATSHPQSCAQMPPRFSDYPPTPRSGQSRSETNRAVSMQQKPLPVKASKQDELESLRTLCLSLEHRLQQQVAQISGLEQVEKRTAELGAQWNFFHHAQMQKQAAIYCEHIEAREVDMRAFRCDMEHRLAILSAENAVLKTRLNRVRPNNGVPLKAMPIESTRLAFRGQNGSLTDGSIQSTCKLKRKLVELESDEQVKQDIAEESSVAAQNASPSQSSRPKTLTIDTSLEPKEHSPTDSIGQLTRRASSAPGSLQTSLETTDEHVDKRNKVSKVARSETMPATSTNAALLKLVDGILPPPVPLVLDQERYTDPKIAEIKQIPEVAEEKRELIPKIVTCT